MLTVSRTFVPNAVKGSHPHSLPISTSLTPSARSSIHQIRLFNNIPSNFVKPSISVKSDVVIPGSASPSSSGLSSSSSNDDATNQPNETSKNTLLSWWKHQQAKSAELRKKLVALGPAAVLAYGLFDGISYTIAFCIAFLGYEAQTGLNPTQNVADIVKIMLLMWVGNNTTRPFRLAGAAALAPFMDKLMAKLQDKLKLPNRILAFAIITASVAAVCFSVIGALFLSRLVR